MGGSLEREKQHRPDLDLAERETTEAPARAAPLGPETGARQAELWAQIGAGPPESPEAAAGLAIDRKGAGRPVEASIAAGVAGQTGVDVSGARVHDDPVSRTATGAMHARAFAHGQDVFLGPGESATDHALIGHELAHVAQGMGATPAVRRKTAIGPAGSPAEDHADQVGAAVASGAAPAHLLVDGGPLAPGQMYKTQFVLGLRQAVVQVVEQELGKAGATAGCPYIDKYFGRYGSEPAQTGEAFLRRWLPNAVYARSAQDLVPLVLVRVRDAVRSWHATKLLPPDLAAIDPSVAADASAAATVHKKSLDGMEAELGPGQPLDGATASRMSRAVGADVSNAKVHTGPVAASMAAEQGAAAFAVGPNVVMGSHAPTSGIAADVLLAHELAHTAQQADAARDPEARRQPIGPESAAAEHDARLARLGNFAGAVGDVMRTGLQMQRCQMGEVDAGPTTEQYYHQYLVQIAAGAAEQLRTLPFSTYDDTVSWTANGMQQFAGAMADQVTGKTDLDSLVRPELIGKLIADSRVVTQQVPGGVDAGSPVSKGPDAYFPSVGTEVGNALARRTAESLQREVPRYAQARIAAGGKEPAASEVNVSHPIDPLVVSALSKGNVVAVDTAKFQQRHPELSGPPRVLRQSREIKLSPVAGQTGWYRLESPMDATPEEVSLALTGSLTETFRLEVAHPLYGLEDDTRNTFTEEANPVSRATQLASSTSPAADEAALSQAGPVDTRSARPRARILEQMRQNAQVLRTSVFEAAAPFEVGDKVETAASFIDGRALRLAKGDDAEVAKWDKHVQRQADVIARAGRGLAADVLRLDAYKSAGKDKGNTEGLPHDHPLREDALMWANALLSCDLVASADKIIAAASNHSMTLEIEILERGLATPQAAAFSASDAPESQKDFDTKGMGQREIDQRKKLGQLRAQMLADPTKVDPKTASATNEDARNLIFESQVAAQAVQLEHEWQALDAAVDSWTTLPSDARDAADLKTRGKRYYGQWKTIYALIKKGEAGDQEAMKKAREQFEALSIDKGFQSYLDDVKKELETIHQHQMIVMIIAMVAITVVSMGAGSALSGALGGTALVVDGTEIVVGGIGVARNTAAVAGFIAETATFTALSNMAFSKDHSVGALLSDFAKNLVMFGAMRAIGAGIKAAGLSRLIKAGENASTLAKVAAKGGDMLGQMVLNSGIGVMTAWIEQKVKEMFGAKPMTDQEAHDAVVMAVAQAVIFTIGGRLLESPIKKLEVGAAFKGKQWQLALDGWAFERKANLAMQARLEGGKATVAPEEVIEAAHRDQAQIEKEMAALDELQKEIERDPKAAKAQGLSVEAVNDHRAKLADRAQTSLAGEMALTMKERGPDFYEADAAEVARIRATQQRLGATVTEEGVPDPDTGARTYLITPAGEGATPFRIVERVPDWVLAPSGKRIVAAARRAMLPDAKIFSMTEIEREAVGALERAVDQNNPADIEAARAKLGKFSPEEQQALAEAFRTAKADPKAKQPVTGGPEITPTTDVAAVTTRTNVAIGTKLRTEPEAQAVLAKLAAGDKTAFHALGMEAPPHDFDTRTVEWGIGELADGSFVIIRGEPGAVNWAGFPGVRPVAHSHPLTAGKMIKGGTTSFTELVKGGGKNAETNKVNILPSAADVAFCSRNALLEHVVQTPYAAKGGDRVGNPTPGANEPLVQIKIVAPERIGSFAGNREVGVYKSRMIATDEHGNFLWSDDVYSVDHPAGSLMMFEEPAEGLITRDGPDGTTETPTATQTLAGSIDPKDATTIFISANGHIARELGKYQDIPADGQGRVKDASWAAGLAAYETEMAKPGATKDKAIAAAKKAADKAAKSKARDEAVAAATARAETEIANGTAFSATLSPDAKNQIANYNAGTVGGAARRLSPILEGKTFAELETILDKEVTGGNATKTKDPMRDPADKTGATMQDQLIYTFTDGTLIRVKPKGDAQSFKTVPGRAVFSVEIMKGAASASQDDIAFKVDTKGRAVPKGPREHDMMQPYTNDTQSAAYEGALMAAGHRVAAP